jgi:hypothetical protein
MRAVTRTLLALLVAAALLGAYAIVRRNAPAEDPASQTSVFAH